MDGACSTHGRDAKRFWLENLNRRCHLEDLGVDGTIISEWIKK
jgi:hypothetical protein